MARPFHVALLAVGTSFVYTNGVLCYTVGHGLVRILNIKGHADHEVVIDVFRMLRENNTELPRFKSYKLSPTHYGHGILVCRLSILEKHSRVYLLAIRVYSPELILFEELWRHDNTPVVTSDEFMVLYYPQHETPLNYWRPRQLNLKTREWSHLHFSCVAMNTRECVVTGAVHDGNFYAVSCRNPLFKGDLSIHGMRRTVIVHSARVSLATRTDGTRRTVYVEMDPPIWKQSYSNGMPDHRWDFLRIEKDERTGDVVTVLIQRGHPQASHHTARACVKRILPLSPPSTEDPVVVLGGTDRVIWHDSPQTSTTDSETELVFGLSNVADAVENENHGDGSDDSGLSRGLLPRTTLHLEDNSSTTPHYGISQCFVRSYFSTCNSFVDLVNDTLRHNGQEQSLRLRVMTKLPGGDNQTVFWPPRYDPSNPDQRLNELHRTLNPPGFTGSLSWGVDADSFVYGMKVDAHNGQRAIIYVGFDPTVKLHGLKAFNGTSTGRKAKDESGSDEGGDAGDAAQGQGNDSGDEEMPRRTFPSLGASWAWLEEPLYFRPRERNGFDFFG